MPYRISDVDISGPISPLGLSEQENGIAVLVRRKGKPVAFWMEAMAGPRLISPAELDSWIGEKAGGKLLSEKLREGLILPPASSRLPSLSVVICTRNRPELLARCLDALCECLEHAGSDAEMEILVVDNGSSGNTTREVVGRHQGVRYSREGKPGLDFARNRGLHEAKGELVAYLDDDVVVDHGWYAGLLSAWRENPDAAGFTGLVLPLALETEAQIIFESRGGFSRGFDRINYGSTLPGNRLYPCGAGIFGAGANMAFRRDILLGLGGFDEALDTGPELPGGGDLDIFYRLVRAGHPLVYEPSYCVFHEHRREMNALRQQYRGWGLGFMAFVGKSIADRFYRARFGELILWWFAYQGRQLQKSILKRTLLPPSMVLAELMGGIVGLFGGYSRSLRRTAAIRKAHATG